MKNCISFSKFTQRFQLHEVPSDSARKDLNADVLFVILLKVDPNTIFRCILVSKEWLQVISSSCFRTNYLRKWKGKFKVVGFMQQYGKFQLAAPKKLGSLINKTTSKAKHGDGMFINKSHSGNGLVLHFDPQTNEHKLISAGDIDIFKPLPPPPVTFAYYTTAILSRDGYFKVIRAQISHPPSYSILKKTLNIQTFSSSTSTWEESQLTCPDSFFIIEHPGIASIRGKTKLGDIRGKVYWRAVTMTSYNDLLEYDTNDPPILRLIPGPATPQILARYHYDVSGQDYLRCATVGRENMIRIWNRREDHVWRLSHIVDAEWVCKRRMAPTFVSFVSFVPGRSDIIFVAWRRNVFVYHLHTQMLERFAGISSCKNIESKHLVPFTIAELGVWPLIPSSKENKLCRFKRLCSSLICQ